MYGNASFFSYPFLMFVSGHEMDVRDLSFDDESFDVAIDKGTMDAMMTAKGDVWVSLLIFGLWPS